MIERRKYDGRRRSDKVVWRVALFAAIALFLTYSHACNNGGESPTSPGVTTATSTGSTSSGSTTTTPAVVSPTPDPNQNFRNWKEHVTSDAQGNVTFNNPKVEDYVGQLCYYWNGPHPQTLAMDPIEVRVKGGHSKTFPFPELTFEVEETECEVTKVIQLDAGFIKCTNANSANLQPAGTDDLHEAAYIDVVQEGEGEWKLIEEKRSDTIWGECQLTTSLPAESISSKCGQQGEYTITKTYKHTCSNETKSDPPVTKYEFRPCECPCIEKGPIGPVDVGEPFGWGEPLEGKCPVPMASTTPEEVCYEHQFGTQGTEIQYTCKDNEPGERQVCRDAEIECPCIEAPVETVVCTECPTGEVKPEDCHQTCTKTIDYQCKDDVVTTFTEPCVCTTSCVEEGPYVGDPVWFPEILKGPCPETFNTSCREKCHQLGEQTTTWDCTDPTTDPLCRPADCPPDPGVCYYTPDCRVGPTGACPEYMKRYMCNEQGGEWANWNGQNNQCKTSLPGIYLSNFRLVPGQSHKDCLKYTGPN